MNRKGIAEMIDSACRETFSNITNDEQFLEEFLKYFKNSIFKTKSDDLFLAEHEKRWQHSDKRELDKAIEYTFLMMETDMDLIKFHYAVKGGNYCVIIPNMTNQDKDEYAKRASGLYHAASKTSPFKENEDFFGFLSEHSPDLVYGLESVIKKIKQSEIEREYNFAIVDYITSEKDEEKDALISRIMIYAGILEKSREQLFEDVPFREEHLKYLRRYDQDDHSIYLP